MYNKSAYLYDTVYQNLGKDYAAEAQHVHELAGKFKKAPGNALLDVACGTGLHAGHLAEFFQVEGLDIAKEMLAVARQKHPGITFHKGDMRKFNLRKQYDVVTCLFSAIGYVKSVAELEQAVATMARHLKPGGVLFVEPWFSPEDWHTGSVHATYVEQPELKIARMNISGRQGNLSSFKFHFLVGTPEGIRYFTEDHVLTLFTKEEYLNSFRACNLEVIYDSEGLYGRGLYIGLKPQ
jgi:ubiquinone/menaquinone biosynthesis C-methylase UbiE